MTEERDRREGIGLVVRPAPFDVESAPGYLMRLFEANGEPWSRERFAGEGMSLSDIVKGAEITFFERETGTSRGRFARTTATVTGLGEPVLIAGQALSRRHWSTRERRWCPACFADDRAGAGPATRRPGMRLHRRFWWDASCVASCPTHAVSLESKCPTCRAPVTWDNGSLTSCAKGHSLLVHAGTAVPASLLGADAYVLGRLGVGAPVPCEALDALSLGAAVEAMRRLGVAAVGGAEASWRDFADGRHSEVACAGLEVAMGLPGSLVTLLDLMADRTDLGAWGEAKLYGTLLEWARSAEGEGLGPTVTEAIHRHHASRTIVRGGSAAGSFAPPDAPTSVNRLAELVGRSEETVARYLKAMEEWPSDTRRGTPVVVSRQIADKVVALFGDTLTLDEAVELLGIHRTQSKALSPTLLEPVEIHRKVGAKQGYSRKAIKEALEQIAGDAPFVEEVPSGLAPIVSTTLRNKTGGVAGILPLVVAGEVRTAARLRGAVGLKAILVDPVAVRRAVRKGDGDAVGFADLKRLLGIGGNTLSAAIEERLFDDVAGGGSGGFSVPMRSVEAFMRDYVTADALAKPLRSKPTQVIALMAETGAVPVLSRDVHARAKGTVYRRSDVPADLGDRHRRAYPMSWSARRAVPGSSAQAE